MNLSEQQIERVRRLARLIFKPEENTATKKTVNIIHDGKQFLIRFPKSFSDQVNLNSTTDLFEVFLEKTKKGDITIKAKLLKNGRKEN